MLRVAAVFSLGLFFFFFFPFGRCMVPVDGSYWAFPKPNLESSTSGLDCLVLDLVFIY